MVPSFNFRAFFILSCAALIVLDLCVIAGGVYFLGDITGTW